MYRRAVKLSVGSISLLKGFVLLRYRDLLKKFAQLCDQPIEIKIKTKRDSLVPSFTRVILCLHVFAPPFLLEVLLYSVSSISIMKCSYHSTLQLFRQRIRWIWQQPKILTQRSSHRNAPHCLRCTERRMLQLAISPAWKPPGQ